MLDDQSSAELLKARLNLLLADWQAVDPRVRTKREFARRCGEVAGVECTPQALNGWVKTGRMDKRWIPIVETVLGASLGFSAAPAEAQATSRPPVAPGPDWRTLAYEIAEQWNRPNQRKLLNGFLAAVEIEHSKLAAKMAERASEITT